MLWAFPLSGFSITHVHTPSSLPWNTVVQTYRGNFSTVKLGINKETQERCAIKIIDKSLVKNKPEMLTNEVDILLRVNHPGIIGLLDLFDTPDKMMLCMELYVRFNFFREPPSCTFVVRQNRVWPNADLVF